MSQSRREFFKTLMIGAGATIATQSLSNIALAEGRRRGGESGATGGDLPLVTPGQGMAASVNYVHKGSDIKDAKLKVDRQGVKFADQKCSSCILYTKHGVQGGEEVGKCQLFANQLVKASGWCTSWAKKS
jgi:hypothetical protein